MLIRSWLKKGFIYFFCATTFLSTLFYSPIPFKKASSSPKAMAAIGETTSTTSGKLFVNKLGAGVSITEVQNWDGDTITEFQCWHDFQWEAPPDAALLKEGVRRGDLAWRLDLWDASTNKHIEYEDMSSNRTSFDSKNAGCFHHYQLHVQTLQNGKEIGRNDLDYWAVPSYITESAIVSKSGSCPARGIKINNKDLAPNGEKTFGWDTIEEDSQEFTKAQLHIVWAKPDLSACPENVGDLWYNVEPAPNDSYLPEHHPFQPNQSPSYYLYEGTGLGLEAGGAWSITTISAAGLGRPTESDVLTKGKVVGKITIQTPKSVEKKSVYGFRDFYGTDGLPDTGDEDKTNPNEIPATHAGDENYCGLDVGGKPYNQALGGALCALIQLIGNFTGWIAEHLYGSIFNAYILTKYVTLTSLKTFT